MSGTSRARIPRVRSSPDTDLTHYPPSESPCTLSPYVDLVHFIVRFLAIGSWTLCDACVTSQGGKGHSGGVGVVGKLLPSFTGERGPRVAVLIDRPQRVHLNVLYPDTRRDSTYRFRDARRLHCRCGSSCGAVDQRDQLCIRQGHRLSFSHGLALPVLYVESGRCVDRLGDLGDRSSRGTWIDDALSC